MLSPFQLVAVLLTLTAAFAWINHKLFRLPSTIGILLMGLSASLCLVSVGILFPNVAAYQELHQLVRQIDFSGTLLNGMLGFLLFAGALHVDLSEFKQRGWIVGAMATMGVLISTVLIAAGIWIIGQWSNAAISFTWALVFGALISPTDPVAVLSTLKQMRVPKTITTDMSGEALFNDGVGVVLFTILLAAATTSSAGDGFGPAEITYLFFVESLGGGLLGFATGYIASRHGPDRRLSH